MANPDGNPNITKVSKKFGQPGAADPREAAKKLKANPSSIRLNIRRLMAREVDPTNAQELSIVEAARYLAGPNAKGKVTTAHLIAATAVSQAVKNFKAMGNLIENVDGKVASQVNHTLSLETLVTGNYDQLEGPDDDDIDG